MERNEILKQIGFTDAFIEALQEFEKKVPVINYEVPFDTNDLHVNLNDDTDQLLITSSNDNYNHNLIVRQGM